jgi:hypothetical protein
MAKTNFDYESDITITLDDKFTVSSTAGAYSISDGISGGLTWNNGPSPTITIGDTIDWGNLTTSTGKSLQVEGDAEINGDLKVNGKSILSSLENIEERLAILNPNPELEDRWEELRELRNKYQQLEKEIIEKEKMWSMLKK